MIRPAALAMKQFAEVYAKLKITQEQRSLLGPLINEVSDAMCDMDKKNILKKHKHSELESILTLMANKLVDPDLFKDL